MASRTPKAPIKDTHRIGGDVYIRDPEDATVQYKARTFHLNYETAEADIGLFPRRWGTFSELHLPMDYRITVALADLSLEPYPGAVQLGFEDVLILRGEKPPAWTDNAGRVHEPGCEEPGAAAPAPVTVVGGDGVPEPEFSELNTMTNTMQKETAATLEDIAKSAANDPALAGKPVPNMAIGVGALKPAAPGKPPLFSKAELLAQLDRVKAETDKLKSMIEAVL